MKPIELVGYVDENHQLRAEVPANVAPGPVKVIVEVAEDEDDGDWGRATLARWAAESDDPREDIYTFEDGVPYRASR